MKRSATLLILFIIVQFANLFLWVRTARDGLDQVGTFAHAHAPQRWCSRAFLRTALRQTVGESNLRVVYNLFRFLFFQNISIYIHMYKYTERFTNGSRTVQYMFFPSKLTKLQFSQSFVIHQDASSRPAAENAREKLENIQQQLGLPTTSPGPFVRSLSRSQRKMLNSRELDKVEIEHARLQVRFPVSPIVVCRSCFSVSIWWSHDSWLYKKKITYYTS